MLAAFALSVTCSASAQYYEIANQLPGLIQPALIGGFNYKGYVDADYIKGVGNHNVDFLGFSTTQGLRYADWFFMGVGIGVDVVFSHTNDDFGNWGNTRPDFDPGNSEKTGVMIPLYTDFRFNIGGMTKTSFFINLKVGCSFLVGDNYMAVDNGYLTSQQYFLLRPSLGVRIPVSSTNPKQAFNISAVYQLLTSNYWDCRSSNITLNGVGVDISFEW